MDKRPIVDRELTLSSITTGLLVGIVMTAANVYLGLYAGMTVSASIPAAVLAAAIYRGILRQQGAKQINIVQTIASAGESLAAGIIFTLPALVLVGAWTDFKFWPTTLIAISGGLLGIVFMIPLRRELIVKRSELTYPEGVACAEVIKNTADSEDGQSNLIFKGLLAGALIKVVTGGLGLLAGSIEKSVFLAKRVLYVGSDVSLALLGVGYIVGFEVSVLVFLGGAISWWVALPIMSSQVPPLDGDPLALAWQIWSTKIRFIGVGAMLVGGFVSVWSVRSGLLDGANRMLSFSLSTRAKDGDGGERDMSSGMILLVLSLCFITMVGLYQSLLESFGMSFLTALIMLILSFPCVAVSSYLVGLVGSSNNPVSGITIAVLLMTAGFFLAIGYQGEGGILATLGVAAVVCCAACTAGDCSQDLKTGQLMEATPRSQQYAQILGVLLPALVIAPVLSLLHHAEGIGTGLKAPQATLFASIVRSIFGKGQLPYDMLAYGVGVAFLVLFIDGVLKRRGHSFRLHLMPLAVGLYLPFSLTFPILIGGALRILTLRGTSAGSLAGGAGILLASGLIAGEAISGVLLAGLKYFDVSIALPMIMAPGVRSLAGLLVMLICCVLFYRSVRLNNGGKGA